MTFCFIRQFFFQNAFFNFWLLWPVVRSLLGWSCGCNHDLVFAKCFCVFMEGADVFIYITLVLCFSCFLLFFSLSFFFLR